MKTLKEQAWQKAYNAGRTAYLLGSFDDDNPHGHGNMLLHYAWFAGFCDQHTEEQGRGAPLPSREEDLHAWTRPATQVS
ncbi:MAG TPA: hypothetical protein VIG24_13325 [Acidimicrobiia bacterium]